MKYFFLACIIFVVGAIGLGFYFSGTPSTARAEKFDDIRISDLSNLQNNIVTFYQIQKRLPNDIKELVIDSPPASFYMDPETKVLYEYKKKNEQEFSLCANFTFSSLNTSERYSYFANLPIMAGIVGNNTWQHSAGTVCFDRKIDPQILNPSTQNVPFPKG